MKIIEYNINELIKSEYNPRELSKKQHQELTESITKFGLVDPIIINTNSSRKNIIVGGHQRYEICKQLGMKTVPCVEIDMSEEKEKELNIRLNKNHGQWDFEILANNFDVDNLIDWGFTEKEIKFSTPEINEIEQDESISFDDNGEDYMPSQVRMVQLFLDSNNEPVFKEMCQKLADSYNTKNLTDTIFKAVENESNKL